MSYVGYLNIVNCGLGTQCFFMGMEDETYAIRLKDGEFVRILSDQEIIEASVEQKNKNWIIKNYEYLQVHGLRVEIEI